MQNDSYNRAKERVKEIKGFYSHLISYLIVNVALIIINLATNPEKLWFYWVTIFWGIGLIFNASSVFLKKGKFLGKDWEQRKIKEIMDREDEDES